MIKAVVVDDDYYSRFVLKEIIRKNFTHITMLGEAGSVDEGIDLIAQTNPELVFLDISMPDGSGFDLLDRLSKIDFRIIFTTAYSEYAIRAFKYSAFDYIMKPIKSSDLEAALARMPAETEKVETFTSEAKNEVVNALKSNIQASPEVNAKTIALPDQDGFAIIEVDRIIRCEGLRNYTRIIFREGNEKISSKTLLEFEHLLSPLGFIRIHRSHLVNLVNVVRYIKSQGGYVELKSGEKLKVSPKHKDELLNKLLYNKL